MVGLFCNYISWESNEPMLGVRIQLNSDPEHWFIWFPASVVSYRINLYSVTAVIGAHESVPQAILFYYKLQQNSTPLTTKLEAATAS